MSNILNPLKKPADASLLSRYLSFFHIDQKRKPIEILASVVACFAQLPYENLTKIIKLDEEGAYERSRHSPAEVIENHIALGAGGTCFSLTAALLHLVRALGYTAEPILADRRYGENTHCALMVWIEGMPCLVDPGFLLLTPVNMHLKDSMLVENAFNTVKLTPKKDGQIDLYTLQNHQETYRLTFKPGPADEGEFLRAWDHSFDWDMMNYPLVTRVLGNEQIYLRGNRLQFRSSKGIRKQELSGEQTCHEMARLFGIHEKIVQQAVQILRKKGNKYG